MEDGPSAPQGQRLLSWCRRLACGEPDAGEPPAPRARLHRRLEHQTLQEGAHLLPQPGRRRVVLLDLAADHFEAILLVVEGADEAVAQILLRSAVAQRLQEDRL